MWVVVLVGGVCPSKRLLPEAYKAMAGASSAERSTRTPRANKMQILCRVESVERPEETYDARLQDGRDGLTHVSIYQDMS